VRPEQLNFNTDSANASTGNYKSLSPKEQTSRFMSQQPLVRQQQQAQLAEKDQEYEWVVDKKLD
jgi:hypothetical protein